MLPGIFLASRVACATQRALVRSAGDSSCLRVLAASLPPDFEARIGLGAYDFLGGRKAANLKQARRAADEGRGFLRSESDEPNHPR